MDAKKTNLILLTLGLGTLIGSLNTMMFNVALPTMVTYFDAPLSTVQWLTSGYMLAAGVVIPAAGFLGDRFGYKRIFTAILFCILALSIAGAFAWCIEVLIIIRLLFGFTGGLLSPLALAMFYRILPVSQQTKAASIWGMATMFGAILPTVLTGLILSIADWRFLLLFNVPFALLAAVLSISVLPKDSIQMQTKLDFTGIFLTSVGSFILLFTFSNLSSWGFSLKLLIGFISGLAFLLIYIVRSRNRSDVVLNLNVFKYRRYPAAFLVSGINIIALCTIAFLMPLLLQNGLGISPLATGIVMLPCSIVSMLMMPVGSYLYNKTGEKLLTAIAILIIVAGSIPFLTVTPSTSILLVVVIQIVRGCGMGLFNLIATNSQMSAIPPELSGHASSLTNWFQQMLNALMVGVASNIVDLRITAMGANTPETIALAYTTTTNMVMAVSCILLLLVIPIAMKFFRSKKELRG
ncbi:MAG: MFS transporter [Peptococcaceae bacterium]|nr:MFS transporter [Peptococcaceae bacterium]